MNLKRTRKSFISLLSLGLLIISGCGGSGSGGSAVSSGGLTQGVLVDPYIQDAVLQEISPDGTTIRQRSSTISDVNGRFSFSDPLQPAAIIETKISSLGTHVGAANQVVLRRLIRDSDEGTVVVSPLTTLIANGSSETELVDLLQTLGLPDFSAPDIYLDPMAAVSSISGDLAATDLTKLHAAMAVANYLEATGNMATTVQDLNASAQYAILGSCLDTVMTTLDPRQFNDMRLNDQITGLTPVAYINKSVEYNRQILTLMKEQLETDGVLDNIAIQNAADSAVTEIANSFTGQGGSGTIDGSALYAESCAFCHGSLAATDIPGRSAEAIQSAIDQNLGGMQSLSSLTTEQLQAIASALPIPDQPSQDGAALYNDNCLACHGSLANTDISATTAGAIQSAIDSNLGGMGFLASLSTVQLQAIASVLPGQSTVDPTLPPDGTALYGSECQGCHGLLAETNVAGASATAIQSAIDSNLGNMGFLTTLTAEEIQAIADALPEPVVVDPSLPPDGTALYADNCAGCHGPLAESGVAGSSATAIQTAIDGNIGNMGYLSALTAEEIQAIADVLPPADTTGPDYSNCTACHSQPPDGTASPNTDGAHSAHSAIASIGTNCQICHDNASHNGSLDLAFPAAYDAASGFASVNLDGTCSNISCHGGNTTPDWSSGSLDLTSSCVSCHSATSGEYTSQTSGEHNEHRNYNCTVCHNSSRMNDHIGDLATETFEVAPASTVGGSGTSVGNYDGTSCSSIACHGSESWF